MAQNPYESPKGRTAPNKPLSGVAWIFIYLGLFTLAFALILAIFWVVLWGVLAAFGTLPKP